MIINLIGSLAKLAIFYMIFTTTIHILTKKYYLTPPTQIGYKSYCGNFSQPI